MSPSQVWVTDSGGSADPGALYEVGPGGTLTPLSTSMPLPNPTAIQIDPVTGDLLVLETGASGSRSLVRVDPLSGTVS